MLTVTELAVLDPFGHTSQIPRLLPTHPPLEEQTLEWKALVTLCWPCECNWGVMANRAGVENKGKNTAGNSHYVPLYVFPSHPHIILGNVVKVRSYSNLPLFQSNKLINGALRMAEAALGPVSMRICFSTQLLIPPSLPLFSPLPELQPEAHLFSPGYGPELSI